MAYDQEPNLDGDGSSYFRRTVILKDWWLIKCSKEFEGKRFGVAGSEISSVETRAMRVFTSSPIIKAIDVFTVQASDGICITLRGFLNKERIVKSGFSPEISREFIFGFPPCWEKICNSCFGGVSFSTDINTVPSIIDKACCPILSPCKITKGNLEDTQAECRDKSTVTETNTADTNLKDGRSGGSIAIDKKTMRTKSLRLQSKSVELSKVQNTTNDGDHGSEGLDNAKSSEVEKDECEAIDSDVILPADGCGRKHIGADNVDKVTRTSATGESLNSEQRKGEHKVTRTSPHSLFDDLDKTSKPGKKRKTKKSGKTLESDYNHCETKAKSAENKRTLDVNKVQNPTTNDGKNECVNISNEVISPVDGCGKRHSGIKKLASRNATKDSLTSEQRKGKRKVMKTSLHSVSKDLKNSSKCKSTKKGKSKKSETTLDWNVVEPVNHSGSKIKEAEENLSGEKTKRKIDFDVEVTPDKKAKKQKTIMASTDSLGQKRSRSGRVLVSALEFWRNQVPVYDMDRNLVQVKEGHETNFAPSKGRESDSRKPRRTNKQLQTTLEITN